MQAAAGAGSLSLIVEPFSERTLNLGERQRLQQTGETVAVKTGRTSLASETSTLKVGDTAPEFELPEHRNDATVSLASFRGKQHVVLVFYPLDWTPT